MDKNSDNLNAEAVHGAGSVAINRISIKQSRFRIIMGGEEQQVLSASHLDVAIVRTNPGVNKTFYIKQWRPGQEPETPDCMSADGVTPLHGCKAQQADYCATCPQNAWGSRINPLTGAKGKACMDGKRLAIVPASNLSGDMFQLAVPPASLKDYGLFARQLNQLNPPVAYNDVVVRISFDTDVSFPKLKFEPVRYLSDEEAEIIQGRFDDDETRTVCGIGQTEAPTPRTVADGFDITLRRLATPRPPGTAQ